MPYFGCLSFERLYSSGRMSSAAPPQPLTAKPMNKTKGQSFDTDVNEWSELLRNEQEVAVHTVEVPIIGTFSSTLMQGQVWKNISSANPTKDWVEMRHQTAEVLQTKGLLAGRTVESKPSNSTFQSQVTAKKFHPGTSILKSAPAAPPPPSISSRGKSTANIEQTALCKSPTDTRPNIIAQSNDKLPSNNKRSNNQVQQSDKEVFPLIQLYIYKPLRNVKM